MQVVDRNGRLKVEITSTVDDISIGVTTISGGTNGRVLYDNAGVVGEIAGTVSEYIAGDGSLQTFPTSFPANKMVTVGRNATGSTLYKGTIVYILGSTGNRPNFVKAQANTEATSAGTFGVIESDIANNSDGNCVTIGTIDNLDTRSTATHPFTTDTLADGDTIYLSPTTAGYVTNVKPYAPSHLVYVGKVVRTSPTNGTIVYRIQNGYELDEIHDVAAQTPSNNDALAFETSTQLWKPKSIPTLLGYTPVPTSRTLTINGTTQDLSADRTFTISTGITIGTTAITSGTVGRVLFQGTGNVVQQSSSLSYDDTIKAFSVIGNQNATTNISVVNTDTTNANSRARISVTSGTIIGSMQSIIGNDVYIGSESAHNVNFTTSGTTRFNLNNTSGNLTIGALASDLGARLGIKGVGNTSATKAFIAQNSSSTDLFTIWNDGAIGVGTSTNAGFKLDVNGTARVTTLTLTTNSGFLNVGNNSAVWFADPNNILRLSTSGFVRFNITTTGVVTAPTLNSNLITSTTNVEANNQSIIGYQNQELTNRNINNINKSIFLAQTTGGGSVQNAPVLRYFHALKGNVTGFTSYRGIEVEDMNSFFGTTSGSVGIGANTLINASAILDVTSTTQGFLPPRMTTTQKNAIASPAAGLMVYDTTLNLISVYNGTIWITL